MEISKIAGAFIFAAHALAEKEDEINKLNVFPVPDGDTGTNMSLTLKSVEDNIMALGPNASKEELCRAITTGALMGARGNSGVITSQILRGVCEGIKECETIDTTEVAVIFDVAEKVAFSAVRKPVKGTILTVLSDVTQAARASAEAGLSLESTLEGLVDAGYESVKETPEYLPILKENNVVDAGGYGLAIFLDGFVCSILGKKEELALKFDASSLSAPKVEIEQINDWEGSKFRYCNEFLVDSDVLDIEETLNFLSTMGDCELCVGSVPKFKVHVHSNEPDKVLKYFLDRGQISEVHIHNMQLQSQDRVEKLSKEQEEQNLCVVAVCAGEGNAEILKSLEVDVVVSGGQTMNPSTKDLYDAAMSVPAKSYLFLPNNSNIIMAAGAAANLIGDNACVLPTKSVPEAFSALFELDKTKSAAQNMEAMSDILGTVITGEVTTAIKDSHDANGNKIKSGDVIGILNGEILSVGKKVSEVTLDLIKSADADNFDTVTLLRGADFSEKDFKKLTSKIETKFSGLEVDPHDGGQPLYPIVFALE